MKNFIDIFVKQTFLFTNLETAGSVPGPESGPESDPDPDPDPDPGPETEIHKLINELTAFRSIQAVNNKVCFLVQDQSGSGPVWI